MPRALLTRHPLAGGQPVYAVDCGAWVRDDAETSPDRGFYCHPARHSAGRPIVAGRAHQWLAQLGFARDSWTAPLDVERVRPGDDANGVAVGQIKRLVERQAGQGSIPLVAFDAGRDPVALPEGLAEARAAVPVRPRRDRRFYADPTSQPRPGRPRRPGHLVGAER